MKILFVCRNFDDMAGGVERQAIALMNEMVQRGHAIHLITWDKKDAKAFYPMSEKIDWLKMDIGNPLRKASLSERLKRLVVMRKAVKKNKPDVIIAYQYGCFITARVACLWLGIPMIQAERNSVSLMNFTSAGKRRNLIFQSMRLASLITVQCRSYVNDYPAYLRRKIRVIPNAVIPATCFAQPDKGTPKIVLSIGRLSYQKNMDTLICAFAKIEKDFPDWHLKIVGEGEKRAELEALIKKNGLQNRVTMLGAVKDVSSLYTTSHLFAIASRWEGFPNVIGESLAHGLPCVAFEGCSGMADLITSGENGLLASGNDDSDALADMLARLMLDKASRIRMGKCAINSVKPYETNEIYNRWEELFCELL